MEGGCNEDCTCCKEGECLSWPACETTELILVLIALTLLLFIMFMSAYIYIAKKRRRMRRIAHVGEGRPRSMRRQQIGSVQEFGQGSIESGTQPQVQKRKVLKGVPDADIPISITYVKVPQKLFKVYQKSDMPVIALNQISREGATGGLVDSSRSKKDLSSTAVVRNVIVTKLARIPKELQEEFSEDSQVNSLE